MLGDGYREVHRDPLQQRSAKGNQKTTGKISSLQSHQPDCRSTICISHNGKHREYNKERHTGKSLGTSKNNPLSLVPSHSHLLFVSMNKCLGNRCSGSGTVSRMHIVGKGCVQFAVGKYRFDTMNRYPIRPCYPRVPVLRKNYALSSQSICWIERFI